MYQADHDFCKGAREEDILQKFIRKGSVRDAPRFQPTEEEFQNPFEYLRKVEFLAGSSGISHSHDRPYHVLRTQELYISY